jgi:MarR family transcriptional regulator, 2-MHQ and catechol-resistance regulon repressor
MRELDDPQIELVGLLIEAHAEVMHGLERDLTATTELPVIWLSVLIRLARSPDSRLRMTELARDMVISTSGLTRLIDRIEAAGLVERQPCPQDRRGLHAVLTPLGRERLAELIPKHVGDIQRRVSDHLSDKDRDELMRLLRKVRNGARTC